jgi:hypothetical protein
MMLLVSIAYHGVPRDVALRLLERVSPPNSTAPESVQTGGHHKV